MMKTMPELEPVVAERGRPLYESVKSSLIRAIDAGHFPPGQRMPSTKELSKQMSVSLVTAHRALQELVTVGVLERAQGRGTYVVDRADRPTLRRRLGLMLHREASLADYYHSQILEGMRQAAREHGAELHILHFETGQKPGCEGYLFLNPLPEEIGQVLSRTGTKTAALVVGARSPLANVPSVDVDNVELAAEAVEHLYHLGHRRIGYVGGAEQLSNSRDRHEGFRRVCKRLGLPIDTRYEVEAAGWRLSAQEKLRLSRLLSGSAAPTAVFAGGYYLALDVYEIAGTIGRPIPRALSVVGVDDPPSAAHLSPALTTLRQPLVHLGHTAVALMSEALAGGEPVRGQALRPELIIRQSSGAPRADGARPEPD